MISGVGGFSAYPTVPGGNYPSRQGVAAPEPSIGFPDKNKDEETPRAKILGEDFGKNQEPLVYEAGKGQSSQSSEQSNQDGNGQEGKEKQDPPAEGRSPSGEELSDEEKEQVQELKKRDAEVRAHEQAHLAAAGSLAQGGASYDYQSGPDGKRYAVGGEVSIDTSKVANDPAATITKAQKIRRAALAPAEPSSTDRAVASQASSMEAQARKELAQENQEKFKVEGQGDSASQTDNTTQADGSTRADGSSQTDNSVNNAASANSTSSEPDSSRYTPAQAANPTQSASITDFYKNIQGNGGASQGVSQLDIFA